MTTCIVAQFPWAAITSVTQSEPAGVIVCTDTRVTTTTGSVVEGVWAKQGRLAKNIYVCYTSSHLGATTAALTRVNNTRDVAKIGRALQLVHGQYGGYTELIAVVWPRNQLPEILELMPPQYKPTLRRGIIGIGHRGVLQSFRENFFEQPRPDLVDPLLPEVLERLAQKIGQTLDPPRYRIHDAGLNVAGALAEAIQIRRAPTVGIPIQVTTISNQEVKSYRIASSPDGVRCGREYLLGHMMPKFCVLSRRCCPSILHRLQQSNSSISYESMLSTGAFQTYPSVVRYDRYWALEEKVE